MYELIRNSDGEVTGIKRLSDGVIIPLIEIDARYLEFLRWNNAQANPLFLDALPKLASQLPRSTISAVVKSIAQDKLSCIVTRTYGGQQYDLQALLTKITAEKIGKQPGINVGDTVMVTYLDHAPIGTLPIIVDEIAAVIYPL